MQQQQQQRTYQYNSISNDYDGSIFPDKRECSWQKRIPCFVLVPALLFSALVGHLATIAYVASRQGSLDSLTTPQTIKTDATRAQAYAKDHFETHLLKPCELSEKFYSNHSATSAMASKGGTDPPPPPPPKDGCEATILLLRHCEAGIAREHCGYMGNLRSEYIATLFGNSSDNRWPVPSFIYAMSAGERHNDFVNNWREIETVQPLSSKVNVTIDQSFGFPEKKKFVKHLFKMLREGKMCDKVAVISWKHHDIPHFSHSMGCGPDNGCPMSFGEDDYEAVWEITYSYHKEKYAPYVVEDTSKHGISKRRPWGEYPQWWVYGTVQQEGFDPLKFAKERGSD